MQNMCKNKNKQCSQKSDIVNDTIQMMSEADGIVLGSPVYFSCIAGTMKSFLDRVFYAAGSNEELFRHKVGVVVTAVRRSSGSSVLDSLNDYLMYAGMILAKGNYWNISNGRTPEEMLQDSEAVQIFQVLAKNVLWILKMTERSKGNTDEPKKVDKINTNFIR